MTRALLCVFCWITSVQAAAEELDIDFDTLTDHRQGPDVAGLKRDTAYFMGYQVATIGILYVMPEGVSGWDEEAKETYSLDKWWENVQRPQWDTDDHYINYILHPYWGAAYYVRARDRGYDREKSFIYSAIMSTIFEFGVEALFEQPSIQDLIATPLGGLIFGEYMYKANLRARDRLVNGEIPRFRDKATIVLTDPLGAINRKVDDLLGRDADFRMRTFVTHSSTLPPGFGSNLDEPLPFAEAKRDKIMGVRFTLAF